MVHDVHSLSPLFISSDDIPLSTEHEMVRRLTDAGYNGRDDALEWLKASVRQSDGSRVPFSDPQSVFHGLSVALEDEEWDTRYQCVRLVGDLIPLLDNSDIDPCMQEVLPQMVRQLGDSKITVSMAAVCALGAYAAHAADIEILYNAIIDCGLKADDDKLRHSVIDYVPSFLEASEGRQPKLEHLLAALIDLTFNTQFLRPVEICLHKIFLCVGAAEFDACINQLPTRTQEQYRELQSDAVVNSNAAESLDMANGTSVDLDSPEDSTVAVSLQASLKDSRKSHISSEKVDVLYGFIPSRIVNNLSSPDDNRALSQAVEELRVMVSDSEKVAELQPHMPDFLEFLSSLLDDGVSFQVTSCH